MPECVYQLRCAICAHAHRWNTYIFQFCLFADIVCKVSALKSIIYQSSLIILIVFFLDEYFFL